jgi:alpha-L-rhamnosidase
VAGIRPRTPGFATVTIAPHLGLLKHVSATVPSPKGNVEAEYTAENSRVHAVINLPIGVSGELHWKGKLLKLHEGRQEMQLRRAVGAPFRTDGRRRPPSILFRSRLFRYAKIG